jgi:GNAT superfamily N-acetyltransferase
MPGLRIETLAANHQLEGFDCGEPGLNRFLLLHALTNQRANSSRTYVGLRGERVVGYHTLVVGSVSPEQAPERVSKGLARHPIPLMVLARLAVSRDEQGKGLGAGLLKDAIQRTLAAAEIAGIRALAVHAKDEAAKRFYEKFHFEAFADNPFRLCLILKDVRELLRN